MALFHNADKHNQGFLGTEEIKDLANVLFKHFPRFGQNIGPGKKKCYKLCQSNVATFYDDEILTTEVKITVIMLVKSIDSHTTLACAILFTEDHQNCLLCMVVIL